MASGTSANSPAGWEEMAALYATYEVLGFNYTFELQNNNNVAQDVYAYWTPGTTEKTSLNDLVVQRYVKKVHLEPSGVRGSNKTLKISGTPNQVEPYVEHDREDYVGTTDGATDPTVTPELQVYSFMSDNAGAVMDLIAQIYVSLTVRFMSPADMVRDTVSIPRQTMAAAKRRQLSPQDHVMNSLMHKEILRRVRAKAKERGQPNPNLLTSPPTSVLSNGVQYMKIG